MKGMDAITKFLNTWDGQPMNVKQMIREVHKFQEIPHFKFENLVDALKLKGFIIHNGEVIKNLNIINSI